MPTEADYRRRIQTAEEKRQRHEAATARMDPMRLAIIAEIESLGRLNDIRGTDEQLRDADVLMRALGDAMVDLRCFEHVATPRAAKKWNEAIAMLEQMADAIDAAIAGKRYGGAHEMKECG